MVWINSKKFKKVKFPNFDIGRAVVSFLLEHLELQSRSMATAICEALDDYLVCVNNPNKGFIDSDEYFYEFKVIFI